MGEVYDRQKQQEEIQKSDAFLDVFSKVVSGKAGYRSVIEKKKEIIKCIKCGIVLESQKVCPECGTKVWIKPTKCPKCSKPVSVDEKFCQDCGESLGPPTI